MAIRSAEFDIACAIGTENSSLKTQESQEYYYRWDITEHYNKLLINMVIGL